MRKNLIVVLSVLFLLAPVRGQKKEAVFDGQRALDLIKVLSDDAMEGRKSGLPGAEKAAGLIADKLREWGLDPAGDKGSYFQEFDLEDLFSVAPRASLEIKSGGRTMPFRYDGGIFDEWRVCDLSGSGKFEAEIVLAGYGLHLPDKGYDDYAGADVRGKTVLINGGFPQKLKLPGDADLSVEKRVRDARALGAKAVLLAPDPAPIGRHTTYPDYFRVKKEDYDPGFVVLGINEAVLDFVVDGLPVDQRVYYAALQAEGKPRPVATGVRARIDVATSLLAKARTRNVLARIPGTDRKLKDEVVILGAHMDHLGMAPSGSAFNGANDNASGTAVVMEAARLMKACKDRPRRTIVFALWAAEEGGLMGSEYYVAHPIFPLERTVVNINLDMVGQGGATIGFGGIYFSSELFDFLKKNVPADIWAGIMPRRGVGGSDHLSFLAEGISAFHMVGFGDHLKGHHPRDDWDLIKPELLDKAGRFLVSSALLLADEKGNLIVPDRAGITKFRYEESVNCLPMPFTEAFTKLANVVNPDVDYQLAYVEEKAGEGPLETRIAALKELDVLAGRLPGAPGLSLYGQPSDPMSRPPSRGTVLVAGLLGSRTFQDDPDWLKIYARHGLKYVLLGSGDVDAPGGVLSGASSRMLEAAQQAGVVVILDLPDKAVAAAALSALKRPCLFLAEDMPSGPALESLNKGGHVLGLKFPASRKPEDYYERLGRARIALTSGRVFVWNTEGLWLPETKARYVRLTELFLRDGWEREAVKFTRQTPMSDVLYASFFNLLRMNQRPAL